MINRTSIILLAIVLTLSGCGGGGSGGSSDSTDEPITANTAPVAEAGSTQNVQTGTNVILDGSQSSDEDGDSLNYNWTMQTKPAGSAAVLSSNSSIKPSFTADLDGEYIVSLTVNDGSLTSQADSVTVVASSANSAPVAEAGSAQNVQTGTNVTLDGSQSSDGDGDSLNYNWTMQTKPTGSTAVLSSDSVVNPSFTADLDGEYIVSLTVNDGSLNSEPDTVTVTASSSNSIPVANAGPDQRVMIDRTVTLDATGSSDADGDSLTYDWSFTSLPTGSNATLSNNFAQNPTFVPDVTGDYLLSLIVDDGIDQSEEDNIVVSVFADYASLFDVQADADGTVESGEWQPGSDFYFQVTNRSPYIFNPYLFEVTNDGALIYSSSDTAILGKEEIKSGQSVILVYRISNSYAGPITITYSLAEAESSDEFSISHTFEIP